VYTISGFDKDMENFDQIVFKFPENFKFNGTVNNVAGPIGSYAGFGRWVVFTYENLVGSADNSATKVFSFGSSVARWGVVPSGEKVRAYWKRSRFTYKMFELNAPIISTAL